MAKEDRKRAPATRDPGPDESSLSSVIWSRSQWRQFLTVFTVLVIVVSGAFWIFLYEQELRSQRYYRELYRQFDQEWAYLQKLARLDRIRQITEQEGVQEAVFDSSHLDLSFSYPKPWGDFEESKPTTYHVSAGLKRGTEERLIGAYNQDPPPGHVSGWDSAAVGIWEEDDIDRVCARHTLADTCLTLTTSTGIRYARIRYANWLEVHDSVENVVIYIFVNPESEFPAMALSNIGLRKSHIPHLISDMDAIMDSMVFRKL